MLTIEGNGMSDNFFDFGYIPMGQLFKSESDSTYEEALTNSKIKEVRII